MEDFPEPEDPLEEDYLEIIRLLQDEQLQTKNEMNRRFEDMMEYYTIWVHQIKTPIASMHPGAGKRRFGPFPAAVHGTGPD